jgi:uncharacterized protein YbaP (TraB family)
MIEFLKRAKGSLRPALLSAAAILAASALCFSTALSSTCIAANRPLSAATSTEPQRDGNVSGKPLLMWKVSNGKNTAYLLGSIHLVKPDFYPLAADIEKAFQKSDVLVLEIDDSKNSPGAIEALSAQLGLYPPSEKMRTHISDETAAALDNYLKSNDLKLPFAQMRPWFASLMVQNLELQKLGFAKGIDSHFAEEAKAANKETDQVESAEFQVKLLSGFSDDLQDKMLNASLKDMGDTEADAGAILKAWKDGSSEEMEVAITKDEREHPELKEFWEKTLYERNIGMANKVEEYLKSGKHPFIAVGAAHLVGKRGLVQMLKDRGLTVEQIYSSAN